MGLLADAFSYGDSLKRKVGGLLADPVGTIELGINRLKEDNNNTLNLFANAYPMAGDKTVLNSPAQKARFQKQAADYAASVGLAGMTAYKGGHTAPMKDSGAPLHDLTQIYPDDIYSPNAVRYYGTGDDVMDRESFRKVNAYKGNPDAPVTMYRAVPANLPQDVKINNGDWVTLSPSYAKLHGEGPLGGDYRVIQQNVPARKLFTNGDSIHEFGYDESGKINPALLGILGGGSLLGLGAYKYGKE